MKKFISDYKILYLIPLLLFFALTYKFYLSQGTWQFFEHNQGQFYNWLAQGFLEGKLGVASEVVRNHPGGFGDGISLNGQIYLPWGPFPAIIHAFAIVLTGKGLLGATLTYFFSLLNLAVFWVLLIRVSRLFFNKFSLAVIIPSFVSYAAGPIMFNIGRGYVYEEAVVAASTLFLGSILLLTYTVELSSRKKYWLVFLTGLLFSFAFFSRFNYIMYGPLLVFYLAILFDLKLEKTSLLKFFKPLTLFLIPVILFVGLQFIYNQARFGSPVEFGNKFQKVADKDVKNRLNQLNSVSFIPYNFANYFLAPVFLSPSGKLYSIDYPDSVGDFPRLPQVEFTSSIFLSFPILLAYFGTFVLLYVKRKQEKLFQFIVATQAGLAFFLLFGLLSFLGNAQRYVQDFLPLFFILSLLTLTWIALKATKIAAVALGIILLLLAFYSFGISAKKTCHAWVGGPEGTNTKECRKLYRPVSEFIPLS